MNSTFSRIALAAPAAVAMVGFSIGAAEAAPQEVTDHSQVQPQPDWNDIVVDDFDNGDPGDGPEDEPVDPPADEPADEPADDDAEETDEESDEDSDEATDDEGEGSDNPGSSGPTADKVTSNSSDDEDTSDDEVVEAFRTTAGELPSASPTPAGVQVPVSALAAGGALVAGLVGWAGYRRHRLLTA